MGKRDPFAGPLMSRNGQPPEEPEEHGTTIAIKESALPCAGCGADLQMVKKYRLILQDGDFLPSSKSEETTVTMTASLIGVVFPAHNCIPGARDAQQSRR